ncbi:MAG TPA: ActS/PrrB/RegB family redox-sensitive histidine kinase [Caulobacteraceae bacterium]|jgi:two-component system sensor histidine kinase RegB|nr:ActS/PrrB/RegB family redox-sensitive histidine kinase [Caulobacteraceae bacterium]
MALAQSAESHGASPKGVDWTLAGSDRRRGRLRLRTLLLLRWIAVCAETGAVLIAWLMGRPTPLGPCLGVIAASAWLNVILTLIHRRRGRHMARDSEAALQLGFDAAQLGALLALTGGLDNPFCLLLVAPAVVAAVSLPLRQTLAVIAIQFAALAILAFLSPPVAWFTAEPTPAAWAHLGVVCATAVGIVFTAGYAWQAAAEGARMELALAATEAVLAREQRLSALGGLAAAAAHELGTPLATIQVVAKELLRSSPEDDPVAEDARLLMQQAERCRDILKNLAQKPETGDIVHARVGLAQFLEEVVDPYRMIGPKVSTAVEGPQGEFIPDVQRLPEASHALAAFVENAADFAVLEVQVTGRFDAESISVEVKDDGSGFAPDILEKLGEPYVTSRPSGENSPSHHQGMGLGFFIAKTLLERSGASVTFRNDKEGGAVILTQWPRRRIEAPDA